MDPVRKAISRLPDSVAVDLFESDEDYLIVVDLPGTDPEQTTIRTVNGTLSIEATRTSHAPEEARVIREERPQSIDVEIPLPDDVLVDESTASLSHGVLAITIPRGQPGTPIPIEAN